MKYKKIYLRADAGGSIGWGHYYRSRALADMLSRKFECRFFSNEEILDFLSGDEIVVLDNYFFDASYQQAIKDKGCKLVCIDDLHDRHFCADAIINFGCEDASLYDALPQTKFFLGLRYAMLREAFMMAAAHVSLPETSSLRSDPTASRSPLLQGRGWHGFRAEAHAPLQEQTDNVRKKNGWFVSFGGADTLNLTDKFVEMLEKKGVTDIKAVRPGDKLSAEEIAAMMRSCEYALLSASNTCLEAMACGCKVLAGWWVDNQRDFYRMLCGKGLITPLGYLPDAEGIPEADAGCAALDLSLSSKRFQLIFKALNYQFVNYTDLTPAQSRQVWEMRNLDSIRIRMTNPEPFPLEGHLNFTEKLKGDRSKLYFAVFDGDTLVGSYDYADIVDGKSAERGLYVNPECQGEQIGSMMEFFLEGEIRKRGVKTLTAEVLKDNAQSIGFHESVGYQRNKEDGRFIYFRREL